MRTILIYIIGFMATVVNPPQQNVIHVLYSDHHGWLKNWLRSKLGCTQQAADLAQDTFLRVMSNKHNAESSNHFESLEKLAQPRAYLTSIAKNLVIDYWRHKELERAYYEALAMLPQAEAPAPELALQVLETLTRIDGVLQSLPAQTRNIFLLSQLDGLTYAEIAVNQSCSLPTIKRHMRKAFLACMVAG